MRSQTTQNKGSAFAISRRGFLLGVGALPFAPKVAFSATKPLVLRPEASTSQMLPGDYPATRVWAYNGELPGPEIRLVQGEHFERRLQNGLQEGTSIHWHGLRLPNQMDGVPGVTQAEVAPGASFDYAFDVKDAGTYFYHPHSRTFEQMGRGLTGAFVVEEKEDAPDVDQDLVLLIDDWRLTSDGQIADDFDSWHDRAHGGRLGNYITVNGQGAWRGSVRPGQRLRLRLINAANARIFNLSLRDLEGFVVALDGMPLEEPEELAPMVLAPAQRIDLIVDVSGDAPALLWTDQSMEIATFTVTGPRQAARPEPMALPPNAMTKLGLKSARQTRLTMTGGMMGRMGQVQLGGKTLSPRGAMEKGFFWAFNGRVDMPEDPLLRLSTGETAIVEMVNNTAWPHAMHLHGQHFRVIGEDTMSPWRDTVLMAPRETVRIAFVGETPGKWLLHCHMLTHAAAGMLTWLEVV